jgi:excisionase family DNA binding protein
VSDAPLLTVADVATHARVKADTVLAWIHAGDLRAVNVASPGCKRPRWRIEPAELDKFLAAREAVPPPAKKKRAGHQSAGAVTQFY